ncbi:hypothetical protein F2Q68_00030401 [Brassica cretica]|uniref:Uncharacterized protein n=1 Tax=Brassica cretica TaxID=69181 RepID=A0A8S9G6K5_BRACR|nr:hypothetical protein F2Q68_00030401 [Brassica cretica]
MNTTRPGGVLLKGERLGSKNAKHTNNLIMESDKIYNGGVGVGALQGYQLVTTRSRGMLLKGEGLGSNNVKRINNLHVWLEGAHMREVRIGVLQGCEPGSQ